MATLFFVCSIAAAAEQSLLTVEAATQKVAQDNPDLAQMLARAKAMAAIPSQEGSLPDPQISFNAMSLPTNSFSTRPEDMTQIGFGLSQAIPFPGKLALREQAAMYEAEAATLTADELRLRLLSDVKTLWWQVFYLDRTLEIVNNNHTLLQQFVDIARSKYEVGEGLQQDVLLAQLELSKLLDQKITLTGMRRGTVAKLNALLDQPANNSVQLPATISIQLPEIRQDDRLYQQAESSRPLLESERRGINAAQSKLELAQKDVLPDFNVEAAYGARDNMPDGTRRSDLLSLGVGMNVPIFAGSKQNKMIDQRTSELMQQRYALQDRWNTVRAEITQSHSDYQRAKQQFVLFDTGIIPQARQTVASMLAGYQVNKVDFLNLVRSQITLFEYETQYWKAFTEAQQALAQLCANVGEDDIYE
ncbi:transporter [Methylomonas methanica]|uniref:Transporter n=2 Tax=Methylococcaceae TaxID=403 RepID=A0A177MNZ8_METMH|nr:MULTISPECIES: TolC family protein [Methylomonas]OAI07043.1 transporter [Methylomonas methanica]PKM13789.1 MAG: TolC family protein [Gammaproteobacteria bacterium HGW-Gammaproteobacteria-3]